MKEPRSAKVPPLPWKKVLRSAPVWAALCGLVGFAWLAFNAMTLTPTYLDRIQNVSVDIVRRVCLKTGYGHPFFICLTWETALTSADTIAVCPYQMHYSNGR